MFGFLFKAIAIETAAAAIISKIKNPENKRKLRHIMLDVYNAIKAAYADDPDFQ